jgi:hypothetical protein
MRRRRDVSDEMRRMVEEAIAEKAGIKEVRKFLSIKKISHTLSYSEKD